MSSIGGEYMGIPCGGEPLRRKGNTITEAQKDALRKEGAAAERERIAEILVKGNSKGDEFCPPTDKCYHNFDRCINCWLDYLELSQ